MTNSGRTSKRKVGAAEAFIQNRQQFGRSAFSLSELTAETSLTPAAANAQIRRLSPKVVRPSTAQQFFLIVPPEHFSIGSPPFDRWLDDYFRWLKRPYYLALQSAAAAYGASPQAIQSTQVMTDRPRRPITIGRLQIRFFVKRKFGRTPTREMPGSFAPVKISSPAATCLDLVRYAGRIGGIGRAIETFRPLLDKIKPQDLRAAVEAEDEVASAQRLGYILERLGHAGLADAVEAWLPPRRPRIALAAERRAEPPATPAEIRWQVAESSGEFLP